MTRVEWMVLRQAQYGFFILLCRINWIIWQSGIMRSRILGGHPIAEWII